MAPLRVLTVARWYPSHDVRFRGAFVADLVRALGGLGVDGVVASWEAAVVHAGRLAPAEIDAAEAAWSEAVRRGPALNRPRTWGAGVPVARLPVVDDAGRAGWADRVRAHAALLEPLVGELARVQPFDLVHAHTGIPDGLVAAAIADQLGVPLIVTEHASDAARSATDDPELAAAYRALLDGRRRVVAISASSRARLASALGVEAGGIRLIGNVVDTDAFPPARAAGRDPGELLWVGERSEKKGTELLLRTFAVLATERRDLRLRLIGRSPTPDVEQRWTTLAAELGVADRVRFEPPADRPDVALAMARAAVLVHPSPAETFGVVAAEAVASGLPVAATPSGGVEDVVGGDGTLGSIAAGHDAAALAAAVADVLDRRAGFDPLAMHASIVGRFSGPAVARAYERLYEEVLATRGAASSGDALPAAGAASVGAGAPPGADAGWEHPPSVEPAVLALVVGLQRTLLDRRLAQLPWAGRPGISIVTVPGRDAATPRAWAGALTEVDPDAPFRDEVARLAGPRLAGLPSGLAKGLRLLFRPNATFARRRLVARREELRQATAQRLVLEAWRQRVTTGERPWLVALDPVDVVAARAALDAGAVLAPGGMRWLADRLDAAAVEPEPER